MKSRFICFGLRYLFGTITFFVGVTIFSLFDSSVWVVIYYSIICTLGMTLVLYIPGIFILGVITEKLLQLIIPINSCRRNKKHRSDEKMTPNKKTLVKYILQAQNTTVEKDIIANLYNAGWLRNDIEDAISIAKTLQK